LPWQSDDGFDQRTAPTGTKTWADVAALGSQIEGRRLRRADEDQIPDTNITVERMDAPETERIAGR